NEELQSSNEELQSLNEELETSKEELQSANEELTISNQELLQNQEQLTSARQYSEAIVSTIREPLVVLDEKLRIKSVNASYCRKFKIPEEEVERHYFLRVQNELWNTPLLKTWLEDVLSHHEKKENFEITLEVNGSPHNFILSAQQINNNRKEEELILLAIEDVTHSIMNKRLQQSESRFRQLAEQIPHFVWTARPDGKVNYVNKVMLDYTGKDFDELSGDGWHRIISSGRVTFSHKWEETVNSKEKILLETRVNKHDGSKAWHLLSAVPQKDNQGKVVLWLGTFTNIQEQKNFTEKLEEKVKERTTE